jgi:hypothetical protein
MYWPEDVRMAAARFFEESGHCQRKAGAALLKHLQGDGPPRPGRFCKRWWAKLKKYNSVEDLPRKGRSRKLPSRVVEETAEKIIGKPTPNGKAQCYGSVGSFLKQHPDLAQQVKEAGVQECTIVRSIKRLEPKLMRKSVRIRKELPPKNVAARRRVAAQLKRLAQYKRRATIFVDESSFEFQLPNVDKAWGIWGEELPPKTSSHANKKAKIRVHYIGAVMHGVGSVGIYPLTGTTCFPPIYEVSRKARPPFTIYSSLGLPNVFDHVTLLIQ